jgi:hypothetical protein
MIREPEHATWVGPWEEGRRLFDGQRWTVEHTTYDGRPYPITVAVIGKQYDDGRIQRRIAVDIPGDPITPAEACQLIEALTTAVATADSDPILQDRSQISGPPGSGRPGEWDGPVSYSDAG